MSWLLRKGFRANDLQMLKLLGFFGAILGKKWVLTHQLIKGSLFYQNYMGAPPFPLPQGCFHAETIEYPSEYFAY